MRLTRGSVFAASVLWGLLASTWMPPLNAAAQTPPITLDDLLQAESLGGAWFSPDDRSVAYVRSGSSAAKANWGVFDPRLYSGRVIVEDVAGTRSIEIGRGEETRYHPVMPFNPAAGGPWAPNGRYLLMTAARSGGFDYAYWDSTQEKIGFLPGKPESSFPVFAWAGERLIYAATAEGAPQRNATMGLAQNLQSKWATAWDGRGAAVTVSSANPIFSETVPRPGRLMLATLADGRATQIAEGDYGAVYVSPDGRRFAAIRFAEPRANAIFPIGRRGELEIHELRSDGVRLRHRFAELDIDAHSVAWSPSGRQLLVGGKSADDAPPSLSVIDTASGALNELAPPGLSFADRQVGKASGLFQIGWIGGQPAAIAARPSNSSEAAAATGRSLDYGEHAQMRLDLYVFKNGQALNLTAQARNSTVEFLAPVDGAFAYVIYDGALTRVSPTRAAQRISPSDAPAILGFAREPRYPPPPVESARYAKGKFERIAVNVVTKDGLAVHVIDVADRQMAPLPGSGEVVAISSDFRSSIRRERDRWVTKTTLQGAASRMLANFNQELAERTWSSVKQFDYDVGARRLTGWVVIPPDAPTGQPLPAVVVVYGGQVFGNAPPQAALGDAYLPLFSGQLLAAQGFAVIYPSLPLESGAKVDLKEMLAEGTVAAIDAVVEQGLVDPQRIGIMGQSFGGFSTAAILASRSDRFRAGVALAGIYDWSHGYGATSPTRWMADDGRTAFGFPARGQSGLDASFWREPQSYIRASPIYSVEKMDAPLLILHGDLDDAYFDAARMYNALARSGKQPVLVRYWGEGHLALSEHAVRDQWSRMTTWFDTYLKGTRAEHAPRASERRTADGGR